jgi:hypothetical protein
MMVAPPLLALGAPVTLALRTTSRPQRRRILSWLHDPSIRRAMTRPAVLVADYNLAMVFYLLTPLYGWSLRNELLHVGTHIYFFICGLLFWIPIAAADPVPGRLPFRTRAFLVALGIPINATLAALLLLHTAPAGDPTRSATAAGALTLLIASTVASTAGVLVILKRAPARSRTRLIHATPTARSSATGAPGVLSGLSAAFGAVRRRSRAVDVETELAAAVTAIELSAIDSVPAAQITTSEALEFIVSHSGHPAAKYQPMTANGRMPAR